MSQISEGEAQNIHLPRARARSLAAGPAVAGTGSAHGGGGFPQVVLCDQAHSSGQADVITPRARHGRSLATLQFGDGAGQT